MHSIRIMEKKVLTQILLGGLLALGCGDDAGTGALRITTYGEDYIEKEIPAASGGGEGFVDGYRVQFSKFLVAFSQLKIAHSSGENGGELPGPVVFDLHSKGPHLVQAFSHMDARRWDKVGVTVSPAKGAVAGNASAADVKAMNDNGRSIYVEGKVTKGADTFTFGWAFTSTTRYEDCQGIKSGAGVVVPAGGSATAEFTIHGDHLFYDDLQASDPSLRFEAMAKADADKDREITLDELSKVDLTTLPAGQYGTGGSGQVKNLGQFVQALARTLVHFQGEGHCHSGS